jgi:hypothetical protein
MEQNTPQRISTNRIIKKETKIFLARSSRFMTLALLLLLILFRGFIFACELFSSLNNK